MPKLRRYCIRSMLEARLFSAREHWKILFTIANVNSSRRHTSHVVIIRDVEFIQLLQGAF